jgi:hypothetical protein
MGARSHGAEAESREEDKVLREYRSGSGGSDRLDAVEAPGKLEAPNPRRTSEMGPAGT